MKLATLNDGTRDGHLVVVKRDLSTFADARSIASTLQAALDVWSDAEPKLRALSEQLESGAVAGEPFDPRRAMAPLPRAYEWVDGSAFLNHVRLVRKARKAEVPPTLETDPLVYQGGSGVLLGPCEDIPLRKPEWGLDFESEVAVILGDTPAGIPAAQAAPCIKLVMLANDVTLRGLIPTELAKQFGFFISKPATAFSPVACTPDELGDAWKDGRLHRPLRTTYNGKVVGEPSAGVEMHFGFFELIAHIAQTRAFTAGTLLGSGTISNADRSKGWSCLAEQRMIETIDTGAPVTPFMKVGDTVQIEMHGADGVSLFGRIDQKVVAA